MPLQFQQIPIPFSQGLDTKSDPYQVPMGKMLELENAVFQKAGAVSKRNGYNLLPRTEIGTGKKITSAVTSANFNNNLLLMDNKNLYSYSPGAEGWANLGYLTSCQTTTNAIIHNASNQKNPDGAYLNGIELYVYEDVRGGVYYSMLDYETRTFLIQGGSVSATGSKPKVVVVGNTFIITYCEDALNQIKIASVSPSAPNGIITSVVVYDLLPGTAGVYDVVVVNGMIHILYTNTTKLALVKVSGLTPTDYKEINVSTPTAVNIFAGDTDELWIGFVEPSFMGPFQVIKTTIVNSETYADIEAVAELCAEVAGVTVVHLTGGFIGTQRDACVFYYDAISTDLTEMAVKYCVYDTTGVIPATKAFFMLKTSLNNKVFHYNERLYVPMIYTKAVGTTYQPTHFIVDCFGNIISKQNEGSASARSNYLLGESFEAKPGIFLLPELKKGELKSVAGILFTEVGIVSSKISFVTETTVQNISWQPTQSATLGNNLHMTGGILHMFDGSQICEHGFLLYPEMTSADFSVSTGGYIAAGNYQYQFTYEWTDNFGQIHRSAPSTAVQITSPANGLVVMQVPALNLTNKSGVRIVGYRSAEITSGSPIFYRFTSITSPVYNDTSEYYITVIDDGTIWAQSNDVIYTTGGTVDNIAAPNATIITTFKNRIFLAGANDPNTIWFSKTIVPGEPVSFSDSFYIKMDDQGGPITGLGVMDDHLIVFKRTGIFHLTGEGPDNTGLNNDYLDPQGISSPVGCTVAASISETSQGLIFKSLKGIYMLDRGFGIDYIGAPVEDYNSQEIVATVDVPTAHQIRILCADGKALVYDYFFQQWSTFTNHEAASGGVWNNLFYFINPRGQTFTEALDYYKDGDRPIPLKMTLAWLNFANVQGYARIKDILILGHYKGVNKLAFSICYDGDEYVDGYAIFDSSVLYNNVFGENNTFGDNGVFGGVFNLEQVRLFPNRQKCQSMKLTIEETDSGNEGISFTGMNVTLGVKSTHAKINANSHKGAA